ncbi:MAG TPA: adenylate/guanylate cyclase domain-containing protein [Methylomirabilota bacterium]|nr:adenylate/guanylate cyclase domain-containing protein [Methylomirabilota bacterium]
MASARDRLYWRQLWRVTLLVAVLAPIFNFVTSAPSFHEIVQGVVDAVLVSVLVTGYLFYLRDGRWRTWFRRLGFWTDLTLSSTVVLLLFLLGRGLGQVVTRRDPWLLVTSLADEHLIHYALPFFIVLAVGVQFSIKMNRMVGANVFRYFVTGVYHQPKAEERVFLFLDLQGSTQLAERLGSARYFELLRRFVDELSEPILETEGEIYQYAGDEVVLTWRMEAGVRRANCVRCFFAIRAALEREAARYTRDFGVVPRFRGGLHGGRVTAGELGDLRQQIVFVGDILNVAARLEEYAKRSGLDLVVSGALLERLALPPDLASTACGDLPIRGRETPVAAYAVSAVRSAAAAGSRSAGGPPPR